MCLQTGPGNESCKDILLHSDRLMLLDLLYNSMSDIWTQSNCDSKSRYPSSPQQSNTPSISVLAPGGVRKAACATESDISSETRGFFNLISCAECITTGYQSLTNDTLVFLATLNQTLTCFEKNQQVDKNSDSAPWA